MKRREFIRRTGAGLGAAAFTPPFAASAAAENGPGLTPAAEIEKRVLAARPSRGGRIPADFAQRFGATHYDGRYHFTDKPYLIEGAEKMHELGMGVAKFWLREDDLPGYRYNSDWLFRHNDRSTWEQTPADEVERRAVLFARFLAARQRGVERARSEHPTAKCRVLHCAEVNRVIDANLGIPTVMDRVLPRVAVDLVSWSCYDGLDSPVKLWQGIELLRHHMLPSPALGGKQVFIGEIGEPENIPNKNQPGVVDLWDRAMAVCFALDIPWIVHWELFCNEPNDGTKPDRRVRKAEELKGFWYVRPDGSLGWGATYLDSLLKHAGGKLPQ